MNDESSSGLARAVVLPGHPQHPRLSLTTAIFALFAAFVLARLFGEMAVEFARTRMHTSPDALTAEVILPSMLASESALVLVSIVVALFAPQSLRDTLGLHATTPGIVLATSVGTVMLGPLGDRLMTSFNEHFPGLTLGVVPVLHDIAQRFSIVLLWPCFALLPGLAEELLFRGVLQRSVAQPLLAVLISGGTFAAFHVDPVHVVGVLPLGLFLAWAAARSCTTATICAHVINNSVALVAIQNHDLDVGFGSPQPIPTAWLIISLAVFAVAAYTLWFLTRAATEAAASV